MVDTFAIPHPCWPVRKACPKGPFKHKGVAMRGDEVGNLTRFEASLSKLQFGFNGKLISSQGEYMAALEKLGGILGEFAEVPEVSRWPSPSRIDLVWQFDVTRRLGLPARNLMLAHSAACLRNRMRMPQFRPGSLTWEGKRFELQFYCKSLKEGWQDDVLRVEMRFKGSPEVAKRLRRADWRDFQGLWRVYEETMRSVPSIHPPTDEGGLVEAMGELCPARKGRRSSLP